LHTLINGDTDKSQKEGFLMTDKVEKVSEPEVQPQVEQQESAPVNENSNDGQEQFDSETVTKLIKRETRKAYEKGKREALMELQQQPQAQPQDLQQKPAVAPQAAPAIQPAQAQSIGGIPQMSPEQIKQLIAQEAPKALQEHARSLQQQQLINSFVSKMQAAEAKYPGMEQKLNELDYSTIHPLIQHIDKMENTGDIMHELLENPMKMGNLVSLLYSQPKLAEKAIQSLSASIKMNDQAQAAEKSSNDPFSQQKPSLNAGKDDGDMSVSDFSAMFKKQRLKR